MKITYNLEKDINSGAIEIYSPNGFNLKIRDYENLKQTASFHSTNPLSCAEFLMNMYALNYGYSYGSKIANERLNKWGKYLSVIKNKKMYKCKECGWKGRESEMELSNIPDWIYECPNCRNEFNLSDK